MFGEMVELWNGDNNYCPDQKIKVNCKQTGWKVKRKQTRASEC